MMTCTNSFSGGTFTQQLNMIRRRNQPGEDTKVEATTEGNKAVEEKQHKGSSTESTTRDGGNPGGTPPEAAFGAGLGNVT